MPRITWNTLKNTLATSFSNWRVWALPGLVVTGLVVAARLTGSLEGLELLALDTFLRFRPAESEDDRIVLVGFDDIDQVGYPIPEQKIVDVINQLQVYQPTVIGLHIQKNQVAPISRKPIFESLRKYRNLVVTEVTLSSADQILAPSGFKQEQVGFVDIALDGDGRLRRLPLGLNDPIQLDTYKHSLAIRLVEKYLANQNSALKLSNGIIDPSAMRFGAVELPRLIRDSGGYFDVEVGNPELLLNFRVGEKPFRLLTVGEMKSKKFNPNDLRDRIIIVGITDPKIRPLIPTAATDSTNSLQIQAHAVSQIISSVLDKRLLIRTWDSYWEYILIAFLGGVSVILNRRIQNSMQLLLVTGTMNIVLIGGSYLLLVSQGVWLPIVPVLLVINLSIFLPGVYEYVYEQEKLLKSRLDERQRTIEQTFNTIHNGPLQTLASLIRKLRDESLSQAETIVTLEKLNMEMRQISNHVKQEALQNENSLYLKDGIKLDLNLPLHELFYEVYLNTLDRPEFSKFETLKISCDFEPVEPVDLSPEKRQGLCRFLEEALCNVGKHAEGATTLMVKGGTVHNEYILSIVDDGTGVLGTGEGEGTRYAKRVAAQLKGQFRREMTYPRGTLCELRFPLTRPWSLWLFTARKIA